jgi:hypothetical protein
MAGTSARKRPERLAASPCWPGPGFARADGLPPVDGRDADRGFAPAAGIGVVLPKLFKPPLQCRRSPRRRRWWPPTIRPPTVPSCSRSVPILISRLPPIAQPQRARLKQMQRAASLCASRPHSRQGVRRRPGPVCRHFAGQGRRTGHAAATSGRKPICSLAPGFQKRAGSTSRP